MPTGISQEVIGVDVVEGKEHGDFAVIKGLDRKTKSVCFSFYSRCDEVLLSNAISCINDWLCGGKWTKPEAECSEFEPWWGIEVNGPGLSTFDMCTEVHGMTNLFMTPNFDSVKQQVVYGKGWRTTAASRKKIVGAIKQWLIEARGWADPRCGREMTSFIYKTPNRPEAAPGANDDEVMAFGIALVLDELVPGGEWEPPEEYREDGLSMKLFQKDNKSTTSDLHLTCLATLERAKQRAGVGIVI